MIRALAVALALALGTCGAAYAAFPYQDRLPSGANKGPNDLEGGTAWKYSATPESGNEPVNSMGSELRGVRGAHVADNADVDTAWRTTTGRPPIWPRVARVREDPRRPRFGCRVDLRNVQVQGGPLAGARHGGGSRDRSWPAGSFRGRVGDGPEHDGSRGRQ